MLRRLSILFFLLFIAGAAQQSYAQNRTIDSLLTLLKKDKEDTAKVIHFNKLCREYINFGNYTAALQHGNAALQLAKQLNFQKEIAIAYNNIGVIYRNQGNYDRALENYLIALKIQEETGDKNEIAGSYNNIGVIYWNQGNYDRALENYLAALKIQEETGDKNEIAGSYNNIGIIYNTQGNYDRALENYLAALKIYEETGDKQGIADSYNNIGNIYNNQGNYNKALENYLASLRIREETGDKNGIAGSYNNIGNIYNTQGNYDKALENHLASLKIAEQIGDKQGIADSYNNIGDIYKNKGKTDIALENYFASLKIFEEISDKYGIANSDISIGTIYTEQLNYSEAMVWLKKGLRVAKEIRVMPLLRDAYKGLSEVSAKTNSYYDAYYYYQLYSQFKDSIFNEKNSKQRAEMQTKYETEKKENEIQTQSHKLSEKELLLSRSRLLFLFFAIGSFLLLVLGWIVFSRYKIKKESQIKSETLRHRELLTKAIIETQEKERKRIAQDLHDGFGQTLAGIKINLSTIKIIAESDNQKIFDQTVKSLDEVYKDVRSLSHLMMPKALQEAGLTEAIDDLLDKTLKGSTIKYNFEKDNAIRYDENTAIGLYRVFQELLNNILKHAGASEIAVHLYKTKEQLILMVEDNGIGINQHNKKEGIGLSNIEARVHSLNGTFSISPGIPHGTVAVVRIPLTPSSQ